MYLLFSVAVSKLDECIVVWEGLVFVVWEGLVFAVCGVNVFRIVLRKKVTGK